MRGAGRRDYAACPSRRRASSRVAAFFSRCLDRAALRVHDARCRRHAVDAGQVFVTRERRGGPRGLHRRVRRHWTTAFATSACSPVSCVMRVRERRALLAVAVVGAPTRARRRPRRRRRRRASRSATATSRRRAPRARGRRERDHLGRHARERRALLAVAVVGAPTRARWRPRRRRRRRASRSATATSRWRASRARDRRELVHHGRHARVRRAAPAGIVVGAPTRARRRRRRRRAA